MALYRDVINAVSNVVGTLFNPGYGFRGQVQNHLTDFVWISEDPTVPLQPPSICVPKATALGPGEYRFDVDINGPWYYKTLGAGLFGVTWFPAGTASAV